MVGVNKLWRHTLLLVLILLIKRNMKPQNNHLNILQPWARFLRVQIWHYLVFLSALFAHCILFLAFSQRPTYCAVIIRPEVSMQHYLCKHRNSSAQQSLSQTPKMVLSPTDADTIVYIIMQRNRQQIKQNYKNTTLLSSEVNLVFHLLG